jgi:LemA protein
MSATSGETFLQAIDLSGRLIRAANFALDQWWLFLIAAAALWLALKIRSHHALLGQLDERADAAFGDVDALLIERHTLIGNLVEVVRAFAAREHDVIRDVLDARIDALEALSGGGGVIQTDTQIANVLQNLFTVSEKYPALASAGHYSTLRADLIRIEDRITAARKFYNLAVEELNSVRRAFPGNLIARLGANTTREKFTLGERRSEFAEPVKVTL